MRKGLIVFFALMLMFSFVACGEENSDGGNSGDVVGSGASANSEPSGNLVDWMKAGTFYVEYTATMDMDGDSMQMEGTLAYEDEKAAITANMEIMGQQAKTRALMKDKIVYMFNDTNKSYMEIPVDDSAAGNSGIQDYGSMKKIGTGEGEVNGKTLPYEEYSTEGGTVRFYLDGGKVAAMETTVQGISTLMVITKASNKVPEGCFDFPEGYTKSESGL